MFIYYDVFKLLLNLQESLYTSTNLHLPPTISHEKVLFAFHYYNYIDLHVGIPPLAHSY